jgi:hypothetical protein
MTVARAMVRRALEAECAGYTEVGDFSRVLDGLLTERSQQDDIYSVSDWTDLQVQRTKCVPGDMKRIEGCGRVKMEVGSNL